MLIPHSRLTILTACISATLLLSACQPTNEDATTIDSTTENAAAKNVATDTTAVDPHAGHDMGATSSSNAMAMGNDAESAVLKEYKASMTDMHTQMMRGMAYNDPDSAFAQGMLGHHTGALAMAKIELKYGADKQMRQLAQEIIKAQKIEMKQMQKWLDSHPDASAPMADTQAMQQAYSEGMNTMHGEMMLGITDPLADMAFARGMLPHHKGAVAMAQVQLQYGKDPEMLQLAQEIIKAQQPEIEQMQNWIKANGGTIPN